MRGPGPKTCIAGAILLISVALFGAHNTGDPRLSREAANAAVRVQSNGGSSFTESKQQKCESTGNFVVWVERENSSNHLWSQPKGQRRTGSIRRSNTEQPLSALTVTTAGNTVKWEVVGNKGAVVCQARTSVALDWSHGTDVLKRLTTPTGTLTLTDPKLNMLKMEFVVDVPGGGST